MILLPFKTRNLKSKRIKVAWKPLKQPEAFFCKINYKELRLWIFFFFLFKTTRKKKLNYLTNNLNKGTFIFASFLWKKNLYFSRAEYKALEYFMHSFLNLYSPTFRILILSWISAGIFSTIEFINRTILFEKFASLNIHRYVCEYLFIKNVKHIFIEIYLYRHK